MSRENLSIRTDLNEDARLGRAYDLARSGRLGAGFLAWNHLARLAAVGQPG
jgi:hypothetical protein